MGRERWGRGGSKDGSMETFLVHSAAASLPHMLHATTLRQATRTTLRHAQTCYTPQLSADMLQLSDKKNILCYMPQLSEDMLHAATLRDMLHAATVRHTLHATTKTLAMLLKCETYASRHTCQTCKMQQNVLIRIT